MGNKQTKAGNKQTKAGKDENKKGKDAPQTSSPSSRANRRQRFRQECVVDDDDRQAVGDDSALKFIGLIRGKFASNRGVHIGTGAIIGEDLVLTAAHNVCSINSKQFRKYKQYLQSTISTTVSNALSATAQSVESARALSAEEAVGEFKHVQFAEWLQFYPGLSGHLQGLNTIDEAKMKRNSEGNFFKVRAFKVHPCYITEASQQMYDLCLLQLQTPVAGEKIRILENYTNPSTEISVFGYPLDLCLSEEGGRAAVRQFGAKGSFKLDEEKGKIDYRIATGSGQSGSPIFINTTNAGRTEYFCIGIHKGGRERATNVGIHLNEEKVKWIAEAEEQLTGRPSKVKTAKFPKLPENNVPARPQKDVTQRSLEDYEKQIKAANISAETAGSVPKRTIYLHREAALLCLQEQRYGRAIWHYEAFVGLLAALGEEGRNEDDEEEWEAALVNLAKSYCEAGDHLRSLDLYAQAEAKCREFLTLTIEKESLILNNKGAVLVHLNRFEDALQLFRAAHALRVGKYGEESLMTYNSLENVASMRLRLRTGISESIRDYERVFRFKERKFGVGSREAIRTKSNLAFALLEAGRYQEGVQGCHYCLEKLRPWQDGKDYLEFIRSFTHQMRGLCKAPCTLADLKLAFYLCQQNGLSDLGRELEDEWSKRNARVQK